MCTPHGAELLAQASWPDVCPYLADVGQALVLRPGLSHVCPANRVIPALRPDRVLLLMIYHDLVAPCFVCIAEHNATTFQLPVRPGQDIADLASSPPVATG